jgi:uncharacterized membrane-anchored protein YhcB (DUF1043 family)
MSEQSSTAPGGASADGGAAEQPKEKAQEAAGQAASKVQETVRSQVDQRSTQAGEQISTVAQELRSVGDHLRERDDGQAASLAVQVADRAERVGGYLTDSDADRILSDVEDLGRRQPWLALAGGVAIGVVAARFLKASSSDRYRSGQERGASASPQAAPQPTPAPVSAPPVADRTAAAPAVTVGAPTTSG